MTKSRWTTTYLLTAAVLLVILGVLMTFVPRDDG